MNPSSSNSNSNSEAQLRQALGAYAQELTTTHATPPASFLWLRARHQAQRNARQQALARATLPMRIMSGIAVIATVLTAVFLLHRSWEAGTLNSTAAHTLALWAAPAAALVLTGSLFLLRSSRTPLTNH